MKKFLFCVDLHYGFERKGGHKVPTHDMKAINSMLAFAEDFKPDVFIYGGDVLDCNSISHHNDHKPGATEGLKLLEDVTDAHRLLIAPIEKIMGNKKMVFVLGNHERFLTDLTDKIPALEGLLDVKRLLKLKRWTVIPQGESFSLGKLTFIHGDQLSGGDHVAKAAVIAYERSVRFGHFHTMQQYSKSSVMDYKNAKSGWAIPCLCGKNPRYSKGAPNKWVQGYLWGYVDEKSGNFNDYVTVIVDGKCVVNGKVYKG